jgi:MFS family permease
MLQWSGNALTSYFLPVVLKTIGITDHKTQLIINGCLSIWSLVSASGFALFVDRAGRRGLYLIGMSGMGIAYLIWTICSAINQERDFKDHGYAGGVLAMIFVYTAFYHACSPVSPTYIMEITPYSLRSKASMLYQLTGNLAGLYNSFANPVAMEAIGWRYYIVWVVIIFINLTLIFFFFPETKNRGLEEVAEIFDGPDALSGANAMRQLGLDVNAQNAVELARDTKLAVEQVERV